MLRYLNEVYSVLNTFYSSTGIGGICFDNQLHLIASRPSKNAANDFICLGMSKISAFLSEKFERTPVINEAFYTYFLESNLVCNITVLIKDERCIGAFVTQPVFVNKLNQTDMDAMLDRIASPLQDRKNLKIVLKRVPVINYNKITPIGEVLNSLVQTVFSKSAVPQVICGDAKYNFIDEYELQNPIQETAVNENLPVRHIRLSTFLQIKESIMKGDTQALTEIMNELSIGNVPVHQLDRSNFIRSLKYSFIKICAMGCYTAIEANAPYYKMLDLFDELIRQMESLDNILDIYELIKTSMVQFAKAVAVNRIIVYSKPVRLVLEYIRAHYDEKITLEKLAEYTDLSSFYLSTLIKKETGLMLMDNINTIRIEESKKLLLEKNVSIIDVAQQVGFSYQNHFSAVFKKFTGFTPTEYMKSMGQSNDTKAAGPFPDKFFPYVVEQLRKKLALFPEIYDVARIVDPVNRVSWVIKQKDTDMYPETCYDFWGRNEFCENCISTSAYLQNCSLLKIDKQNENDFLVIAIPKTLGVKTYVIEVLKKIAKNSFVGLDAYCRETPPLKIADDIPNTEDKLTGLFNRVYINENLPMDFRRSRIEKRPYTILLTKINELDKINDQDFYDKIVQSFARVIKSSIRNKSDWAGLYTGDIFMISLSNTDFEVACLVADRIKNDIESTVFDFNENQVQLTASFSIKTLSDDMPDADALVNQALMDLYVKIIN